MSNPPPYNPNNPNNNRRLPSAWQPAAPTSSLQAANVGHSGQQPQQQPQQHVQHSQQQQQQPQQQPPHYAPPPQAYSQQQQQQAYAQQQQVYNPYAHVHNPYYAQHQYYQQQTMPPQQLQPQAPAYQPPARERKSLVITDKNGNPIDLGTKKSTTVAAPPASSTAEASEAAGLKLREAALARIAETDAKKKAAKEAELEKQKLELAQKKADEEAAALAAAKKIQEEEEAKKKAEEEAAKKKEEEEAKKKAEEEAAKQKELEEAEARAAEEKAKSAPSNGKRRVYSKVDLLRFRELDVCCCRPPDLPDMTIEKGAARGGASTSTRNISGGGTGGGGGGGGGGGSSWSRGQAAPPNRRQSSTPQQPPPPGGGGGGQWSRGHAPPPPVKHSNANANTKGGRGGNRGYVEASFDFEPLVKNENRWRPQKNANGLVVAEKKVKSILNKMTKEKFGRLSEQMCEIPLESYETLNMMIRLVYEKAIDEPAFGDMYADLCVLLSQTAQSHTSSYVHFFESDEERDNGSPVVWRWSNDVSHDDAEIVGPFTSADAAEAAALAASTSEPVPRGDMQLELVKVKVAEGTFIKVLKKSKPKKDDEAAEPEEGEEEESSEDEFYVVFFPIEQAEDCGQQMSDFFLTERECRSDASKNNSFRRSLLNQCQDEFNKHDIFEDWKKEYAAYEAIRENLTDAERKEKEEELNFRKIKIKKQMLGNIKFIGQLYKKGLLKEKIMRYCIGTLLKLEEDKSVRSKNPEYKDLGNTDLDEDDHEALGNMFATIGKTIDTPQAKDFMTVCFTKMAKFSDDKRLSSRVRFMYKDLIELRESGWVPRRKEEKAKTLDEIRQDVEREERLQEQQRGSYMGGGRGGGRSGSGGGRGVSFARGGGDQRRSTYDNTSRRQSKQQQTDEEGFTTIIGPRAGAPPARSATGRDSLRRSVDKSPPSQRPIPPAPTSVLKASSLAAASLSGKSPDQPVGTTERKSAAAPLSKEKLERRIATILSEYMADPKNVDELMLSVDELVETPGASLTFVQKSADRLFDCKDDDRKAIVSLIALLFEKKKITQEDVGSGVADIIEFIDSFVLDAPNAFQYLGDMVAALLDVGAVGVSWFVEQTEKTKLSGDPTVAERVVKETMISYVKVFGKEKALSLFNPGADKFADLLGNDKWNAVASSVLG